METTLGRAVGAVALALLLLGAYVLISAPPPADAGPSAAAKITVLKKPPQVAGDVQEGTGI